MLVIGILGSGLRCEVSCWAVVGCRQGVEPGRDSLLYTTLGQPTGSTGIFFLVSCGIFSSEIR